MTAILTVLAALCVPQFAVLAVPCALLIAATFAAERWVR